MDLSNKTLRKYAEMASEVFMADPVYLKVTNSKWLRKIIIREGLLIRMYESRNNGDLFYFDEQGRGMLILKKANRELQFTEMLKCPNAPVVLPLLPYVIKLMGITGRCDNKGVIGEDSYIISPIFYTCISTIPLFINQVTQIYILHWGSYCLRCRNQLI